MKESLLHYLWQHKIFSDYHFKDLQGRAIEILTFGTLNQNAGPDFSFAKIKVDGITLAGNIEIHVKTSDWLLHRHHTQYDYQSVILHVVYEHDMEITELSKAGIPTLELKQYIAPSIIEKYQILEKEQPSQFIACESIFEPKKIPFLFAESNLFKKLDEKSIEIEKLLSKSLNNYEAVLFQKLAYSFGLKVNAEIYQNIAENIDFKIIQKIAQNPHQLESLLLGKGNLLETEITENRNWKREYDYLKAKYKISDITFPVKFLRLMPPSFPTIRLSQLAQLYHLHPSLFSKLLSAKTTEEMKIVFRPVKTSNYWENHFTFEKTSEEKIEKKLSEDFIELLLINAVFPVLYTYHKHIDPDKTENIIEFYKTLKPEKNRIISQWKRLGINMDSALATQAFLYQHKSFCLAKKCTSCGIGLQLLKS